MKRIFLVLLITIFLTSTAIAGLLRPLPLDKNGKAAAAGSIATTYWDDDATDGNFNLIELQTGSECKSVIIQVVSATTTVYGTVAFHYSSTGTAAKDWITCSGSLEIDIGKVTGNLGYVRAVAGYKVAVIVLY